MLVIMISTCLVRYFGNGPFFPFDGFEAKNCMESWWANMLYINNFVKLDHMVIFLIELKPFLIDTLKTILFFSSKCLGNSFF